jgi:hypothetical protein
MLVAFMKEHLSKANIKVIKFSDRIWIDNDTENIEVHREVYFEINNDNVQTFSMVVPVKKILKIEDITEQFLDENCSFNDRSTGEYKLIDKDKRLFSTDNIKDIHALDIQTVQNTPQSNCNLIDVMIKRPIQGPKNCAFKIKIKVPSDNLIETSKEDLSYSLLSLFYFQGRACRNTCRILDVTNREIEAMTILDLELRKGGFDVIVHLPFDVEEATADKTKISYEDISPEGNKVGKSRLTHVWHFREFFPDSPITNLKSNNGIIPPLVIKYNKVPTRGVLNDIINRIKKGEEAQKVVLFLAISGIFLSVISIALVVVM